MPKSIPKKNIKEAFIEALKPFAGAIKEDFNRIDSRFEKSDARFERIETTLIAIVEDLKEARKEREKLAARIMEPAMAQTDGVWLPAPTAPPLLKFFQIINLG